ncbi:hypothetical protein [Pleurocapsa sp. PCC 7319]|uniref:hypothetical protein n=1 Tax=Pleurocapsa sp. PCC 7319 TaxID=118161 RepID=UPI0003487B81|nr:hypothetical protein [Pleurocapsa sp. PCC 7319]
MSYVLKNLEKTFYKLDAIIYLISTNEYNRLDISLKEVITDLDKAIAKLKQRTKVIK